MVRKSFEKKNETELIFFFCLSVGVSVDNISLLHPYTFPSKGSRSNVSPRDKLIKRERERSSLSSTFYPLSYLSVSPTVSPSVYFSLLLNRSSANADKSDLPLSLHCPSDDCPGSGYSQPECCRERGHRSGVHQRGPQPECPSF